MLDVTIFDFVNLNSSEIRQSVVKMLPVKFQKMNPKGLVWVACDFDPRNLADSGPYIVAEQISQQLGWHLLNIVIRPDFARSKRTFAFTDVCEYFLLFVRDSTHRFNKNLVREKHIWQQAEWGKREKNYFPLGKDPGNVWLPTLDDGKGTVIGHTPMTFEETLARCILLAVPRLTEVTSEITTLDAWIFTNRPVSVQTIIEKLERCVREKQKAFENMRTNLARGEARNALVSALNRGNELPIGEYACLLQFDGTTFTCRRASTGDAVRSLGTSSRLSALWAAANGGTGSEIRISKAFNLATATNQAAKVRAAIEGAWFPRDWNVQVEAI
ncbi:MAG: hypothetical protein RBG13Loki_3582 [Promethearchaeota archaeon CR_4]|nr:MAG: hypothetical protein RBG13Loki_3582 [Candidatus Lokiarchaeota archaeon CR_4]